MPDTTDDIDDLLSFLAVAQDARYTYSPFYYAGRWHAALAALVAERDALKKRVAELAEQPADRDLRERDEAMMRWMMKATIMLCDSRRLHSDECWELVNHRDAAFAAMRKEVANDK